MKTIGPLLVVLFALSAPAHAKHDPRVDFMLKNATMAEVYRFDNLCTQGESTACNILGLYYENGTDHAVKKDPEKAFLYYVKACELKHNLGCNNANVVFYSLSDEQQDRLRVTNMSAALTGCLEQGHFISCGTLIPTLLVASQAALDNGDISKCYSNLQGATEAHLRICSGDALERRTESEKHLCLDSANLITRMNCVEVPGD